MPTSIRPQPTIPPVRPRPLSAALGLLACVWASCSQVLADPDTPKPGDSQPQIEPAAKAPPAAADATDAPKLDARAWTIAIEPRVWYVAPSGKLTLPATGTAGQAVELSTLNADVPRLAPAGQVDIQAEKWLFTFSGMGTSLNVQSTAPEAFRIGNVNVATGNTVNTSFEFYEFHLTAGYRVWNHDFDPTADNSLRLWVFGGGRLTEVDSSVQRLGGAAPSLASDSVSAFEIIGGARLGATIARDFEAELELSAGGLTDSASLDLAASFRWRPVSWGAVVIGYRIFATNMTDGDGAGEFRYKGSLAGLFAGINFRF